MLSAPNQRGKRPDRTARVVLTAMNTAPERSAMICAMAAPNATIVRADSMSNESGDDCSANHTKASSTAAIAKIAETNSVPAISDERRWSSSVK
jgi:hypothetical protein